MPATFSAVVVTAFVIALACLVLSQALRVAQTVGM